MSYSIDITMTGMVEYERMMDRAARSIDAVRNEVLVKIANAYVDAVRNEIQNRGSVITGQLLASTRILEEGDGYVIAGSDLYYAVFWEYGRGPIQAPPGKVLHFIAKDGTEVFTTYVGPAAGSGVFEAAAISLDKLIKDLVVETIGG